MVRRGIAFSPPMVAAVMAGNKTQTRRMVKQPPFKAEGCRNADMGGRNEWWDFWASNTKFLAIMAMGITYRFKLPYAVNDGLRVKEALFANNIQTSKGKLLAVHYGLDSKTVDAGEGEFAPWPWKPSKLAAMYCPQWASRTDLKVVAVRVERLLEITIEDAFAEGITLLPSGDFGLEGYNLSAATPVEAYFMLWDYINGKDAHKQNPWVAVYSFVPA